MKCYNSDRKAVKAILKRSFGSGVRSVMSLQGRTAPYPVISARRDAEALRGDWERVGKQLQYAVRYFRK